MEFPRAVFEHDGCCGFIPQWKGGKNRRCEPILELDTADDYGTVEFEGEKWKSHRLSYHLNIAQIPRKPPARGVDNVLHSCDRKWCIKPDHLSLGDAKKNAQDNAARNTVWRERRREAQKKIGFPKVSPEGRARMAEANRKRMKEFYRNNPGFSPHHISKKRKELAQ